MIDQAVQLGVQQGLIEESSLPPLSISIESLAVHYEGEALKPLILRRGRYREIVENSESWVKHRTRLLRELLPLPPSDPTGKEGELRGFLMEIIGFEAINAMCRDSGSPYRVVYAPYHLDMSTDTSKGGDLLFVKEYDDGSCVPICLIDMKMKGGGNLKSGMHWGLNRPLPAIVLPVRNVQWEDEENIVHKTSQAFMSKARRIGEREDMSFLALLSPSGREKLFVELRRRITEGCNRTYKHIEAQTLTTGLEWELLMKLIMTESVLGGLHKPVRMVA